MKVNEYYTDAINADKVLDILKTSIEPADNPLLTLTKYRTPCKTAYKIDYTAYVSKEEYKQIKAIATNLDSPDDETTPEYVVLPENVKEAIEHQCALFFAIANHEDCEK